MNKLIILKNKRNEQQKILELEVKKNLSKTNFDKKNNSDNNQNMIIRLYRDDNVEYEELH